MKDSDVKHLVAFHDRYFTRDAPDERTGITASFEEGDFAVEVDDTPPPEPMFDFFSHVYIKGESSWGVIIGIRWDAVGETWEYQLDTNEDEWVIEDDIEVHVLQKGE